MPVFNHAALFVLDLEASRHFYQNILGFEMVPEPFKDGLHAWFNIGHGTTLHVIQGAQEKKDYFQSNHLCFSVNSLEDFMAVIQQNKIDWYDNKGNKNEITIRPDGIRQIYFTDPDGYWIKINDELF